MHRRFMHRHGYGHARIATLLVTLGALTAAAAGCQSTKECTAIGTPTGVGLEIEPPFAAKVTGAAMKVCWDGGCRSPRIRLAPSTKAGPQSCAGSGPDDPCGVSAVPTGGQHGFGDVPALPKKPVEVTVVLRDASGERILEQRLVVTPEGSFPNGPGCGEGGPQTQLIVAGARLRERT